MFHLVNGESTAAAVAPRFPGLVHAWGEMLMDGPAPASYDDEVGWARRAARMEMEYGIPSSELLARRDADRAAVASLGSFDESVLWFEEDLFCQANLAFILAAVGEKPPEDLTLICPEEPLGGSTDGARLDALFREREPVTPERARLAGAAWRALASTHPRAIERLLDAGDFTPWPKLARGLRLHLARFPSTRDGLDLVSRAAFDVLAEGPTPFVHLFPRASRALTGLGIGDRQFMVEVGRYVGGRAPLVEETPAGYMLTDLGRRVHAGKADAVRDHPIDRWLGGVHLLGNDPAWRWDPDARRLVHTGQT